MKKYIELISFHEAKSLVEKVALQRLLEFRCDSDIPILRNEYAESECCWIFFRNKLIQGPPERALTWDSAYVISKRGEIRLIGDWSDEPDKLKEQIERLSNYFKENGL